MTKAMTKKEEVNDDPSDMPHWIRRPEFDSLQFDPRYAALLHRMHLSP